MDRAQVLHFECLHESSFDCPQQCHIIADKHEIVHIEGYNAEYLCVFIISENGMVYVRLGKAESLKFLLCLLIPCMQCLLQTIQALLQLPNDLRPPIINASSWWFHVNGMFEIPIEKCSLDIHLIDFHQNMQPMQATFELNPT